MTGGTTDVRDNGPGLVAVAGLESQRSKDLCDGQSPALNDMCSEAAGGAGRTLRRPDGSGTVQVSQDIGPREFSGEGTSLDAPDWHETSASLLLAPPAGGLLSLESDPGQAPPACSAREPFGLQFGPGVHWPLVKEEIAGWLVAVRLSNASNFCYQNAATVALMWTLCQLREPMWGDLGPGAEIMANLLGQESLWINLRDLPSFHDLPGPTGHS